MLPLSLQVPASFVLVAGGAIACFGGYRLFKLVLGVYGFILGALVASSIVGTGDALTTIAAAVAGGAIGALVLVAGYVVGVAVVGAGVAVLIVNMVWKPFGGADPHLVVLIVAAAIGAFTAMWFQRHVIIITTAFGGAWTMLVGVAALMVNRGRAQSAGGDMWVLYPNVGPDRTWVYVSWVAISLVGMYVQLRASKGGKGSKGKKS